MNKLSDKFNLISCQRDKNSIEETIKDLLVQGYKYFYVTAHANKPQLKVEDSGSTEECPHIELKAVIRAMDNLRG